MKKLINKLSVFCFIIIAIPSIALAERVGVFYDSNVEQVKFAAGDIKIALESKGFTVEIFDLAKLNSKYSYKKIVIGLLENNEIAKLLTTEGGVIPSNLGEQSYALRTTTKGSISYWVFGGDKNGAMYGGFQIAENIKFNGFTETYNNEESPKILKRGIKLNLPFDKNSTTYFNANNSTGSRYAITNVWDYSFWTTWFDEMARNRYNIISIWNNHPFTSMIKMADYPDVVINDVTGYPNYYDEKDKVGGLIKKMTIDEKIEFWKKVMSYAKDRGFSFYLFNWNLFLYGAEGKYGLERDIKNEATIKYLRKCMYELFKTYPHLDGFGITQGEAMGEYEDAEKSVFLGNTFGMGMADFAKDFPERKLTFIHRWWFADFKAIKVNFAELLKCPNVNFDMSYKYSFAHMYSSTKPDFFKDSDIKALKENNIKTWFTVRNDDFYYHDWGSPAYAREYINNIPGKGDWFKGFYIGSDGYNPTRTFFSKNSVTQGILEVQRLWYMNMIWGRLSYNPNVSDEVFKSYMKMKFNISSADNLFEAWQKVSGALPKVGEMFFKGFNIDKDYYPENCSHGKGFIDIAYMTEHDAIPRPSSNQCGILGTVANTCNGKISSFDICDQIETDAKSALSLISNMTAPDNSELGISLNTIKAMSYLSIYYAYKIRGATYNLMADKKPDAMNSLGTAYCWWMKYTNLMDANYKGMSMQRNTHFATWHEHDASVLKEYTDLGGVGIPNCNN